MPYADNQGLRIHYQVEGKGPPLVLQHGMTQSLNRWYLHGYVDILKVEYQLILIDARGHGQSDKPHDPAAYALPLRVGDVLSVLDDLDISRAHYWGYSMGGRIGFGMAKYAPERLHGLIIGGSDPYERTLPADSRPDGSDPDAFLKAFFGRLRVDQASIPPEIREEILANDFRAIAAAQQDRPSIANVLPDMTMPCLLYAGESDPVFPKTQESAQHIPNAMFVSLPALDHSAVFREAGLILPHVRAFLQGNR